MSKKLFSLISLVLVLVLVSSAVAQDPDYLDMWGEYLFDSPDPNADTSIHDNNIISLGADATVGVAEGYNGTAYQGTPNEVGGDFSHVLLPSDVLPAGGGDFTIEMMINFDVFFEGEQDQKNPLSSMAPVSTDNYYFQFEGGWRDGNFSEPNFFVSDSLWTEVDAEWVFYAADVGPLIEGQWYHWVFSLDTTNGIFRHWFDGELMSTLDVGPGFDYGIFGDLIYLGNEVNWAYPFQGRIDEVRFYRGYTEYYFPPGGPGAITARATRPIPKVLTENVAREDLTLRWKGGGWVADVNGHEVYFGTDTNSVEDANRFNQALYPGVYRGPNDVNIWLDPEDPNIIRYTYDVPETLDLGTTYYWRVDEVNEDYVPGPNDPNIPPDYRWKGSVWNFEAEGEAYDAYPADGATDVYYGVVLSWTAGAEANLHDVYFDSNEAAVEDANTANTALYPGVYRGSGNVGVDPCDPNRYTYDPPENLDLLTTYYWRIDEVNTVVVKGDVWNFVTGDHFVVDDFEPYADLAALTAVWDIGHLANNGAQLSLETVPDYVRDGEQSMEFAYRNAKVGGQYRGSEAEADIANLEKSGPDWTLSGSKALVLYFYGAASNGQEIADGYHINNDQMYVALVDGDSNSGIVKYDQKYNYDMNDIQEASWQEWNIDLADPCLSDVNMADVAKVYIGFGGAKTGQNASGAGTKSGKFDTVWFDDIGVYPTRCRPEISYPYGDLDGDCNVGAYDLEGMLDDWLEIDYEVLSVPPNDANLLVRYTFDAGLSDSSGNAYHGIAVNDVNVHDGMLTLMNENIWPTRGYTTIDMWDYAAEMNAVEIPFPNQVAVWNNSYTVFIEARTHQDNTGLAYENVWPIMYLSVTNPGLGALCQHEITWYQPYQVLIDMELTGPGDWAATADHACIANSAEYGTVADANWHKIVWTYDAGTEWHYCYVDVYGDGGFDIWAEPDPPFEFGNDLDPGKTWKTLIGGSYAVAPDLGVIAEEGISFMTGDVNEIRIYDYALPLGETLNLLGYEGVVYMPLDSPANLVPKVPPPTSLDPNNLDIINFRDYVVMANNWLEEILWPLE